MYTDKLIFLKTLFGITELSKRLKISQTTIYNYIYNDTNIVKKNKAKISKLYNKNKDILTISSVTQKVEKEKKKIAIKKSNIIQKVSYNKFTKNLNPDFKNNIDGLQIIQEKIEEGYSLYTDKEGNLKIAKGVNKKPTEWIDVLLIMKKLGDTKGNEFIINKMAVNIKFSKYLKGFENMTNTERIDALTNFIYKSYQTRKTIFGIMGYIIR